jgi:hypothetical protein
MADIPSRTEEQGASQPNAITKAGDITIDVLEIVSSTGTRYDLKLQLVQMEIFEDLFSPVTSGTITITDSLDLVNNMPFIGEELLYIRAKTPQYTDRGQIFDNLYYIYKMTNREMMGDRNVLYTLHFISPEAIADMNVKLSKGYGGKIHEVANRIIRAEGLTTQKNVAIEDTKNSVKYVSNYWSPFKNLKYLADRAMNNKGASNFVFYEDRLGFNFISLDSLYTLQPIQTYRYDNYTRDFKFERTDVNIEEEYSRIKNISIETGFDYIQRLSSGMYASKLISHDIVTKKYTVQNYNYLDEFTKFNHLNQFPTSSETVVKRNNAAIFFHGKHHAAFNGFGGDSSAEWKLRRISLLNQAEAFKLTVTVPGRSNTSVGMVVALDLKTFEPYTKQETNSDLQDNQYSGRYLVSAVSHSITKGKHEMVLELMKDSLIKKIEEK